MEQTESEQERIARKEREENTRFNKYDERNNSQSPRARIFKDLFNIDTQEGNGGVGNVNGRRRRSKQSGDRQLFQNKGRSEVKSYSAPCARRCARAVGLLWFLLRTAKNRLWITR